MRNAVLASRIRGASVPSESAIATASGNDQFMTGRYLGDPYVAGRCPGCGYTATWHATDHDDTDPDKSNPDALEAE